MVNDLMVVEKIEKKLRLKQDRDSNVFPLTPTHRKELRELRDSNISGLRGRINNIKIIKKEEFIKKHQNQVMKIESKLQAKASLLNKNFCKIVKEIDSLLESFKTLQDNTMVKGLTISHNYDHISELGKIGAKRSYTVSTTAIKDELGKMFTDKFGQRFDAVDEKIDMMLIQYEEAINFGDLDIVKELYYGLKDADKFLDSIANIKV